MIYWIDKQEVTGTWRMVRDMLLPAIEQDVSGTTEQDVLGELLEGSNQLWVVGRPPKAAVVTAIRTTKHKKVAHLMFIGGADRDEWFDEFMAEMDKFARHYECDQMEVYGRKGWEKVGKPYGWNYAYTAYTKEVSHG